MLYKHFPLQAAPLVSAVKEPYAFKLAARRHNKERKDDSLDMSDLSPTEPATALTTPTPFDFSAGRVEHIVVHVGIHCIEPWIC